MPAVTSCEITVSAQGLQEGGDIEVDMRRHAGCGL